MCLFVFLVPFCFFLRYSKRCDCGAPVLSLGGVAGWLADPLSYPRWDKRRCRVGLTGGLLTASALVTGECGWWCHLYWYE